tara:strand:- start:720 stop:1511 length:792 start_codon:yes stop_codon:yes gene_type:complete
LIGEYSISTFIHPTAIVDPNSYIGKNVEIGPYTIIHNNTKIGNNTKIDSHVNIKPFSYLGANCQIFPGANIGEIPQDLKFSGENTELHIDDNTIIREYCTVNRGTSASKKTIIGKNCLLMAYVHIAHDCIIGNNSILANGVQLGGHVEVGNKVIIGGMTPVHQFCKIGDYAFIGGGLRIVQDVPPYIIAMGEPLKYSGINSVGLRRNKISLNKRTDIKNAYKLIFKSNLNITQAIASIKKNFKSTIEIKKIIDFINNSNRGLI